MMSKESYIEEKLEIVDCGLESLHLEEFGKMKY